MDICSLHKSGNRRMVLFARQGAKGARPDPGGRGYCSYVDCRNWEMDPRTHAKLAGDSRVGTIFRASLGY